MRAIFTAFPTIGLILMLALSLAGPSRAGTASTQFNVTATVLNNCAVSASDLAFGSYSTSSGTPATASTTLQVTCTASLPYNIALKAAPRPATWRPAP